MQLRPVEAWDLLDVLSRGDESALGNIFSRWRRADVALDVLRGRTQPPDTDNEQQELIRNPLPLKPEHHDFEILRRRLDASAEQAVVPCDALTRLRPQDRKRLTDLFPRFVQNHNLFIRRIVRRTREQLEKQIDPETNEPLL